MSVQTVNAKCRVYLDSSYRRRGAAPTSDPKFRAQGGKVWAGSSPSPASPTFMPGRTASLSRRRHEGGYPLSLLACSIPPTSIDRALFHGPGDSDKLSLPRIGEGRRHPPAGAKPPKSRPTAPPPHLSVNRNRSARGRDRIIDPSRYHPRIFGVYKRILPSDSPSRPGGLEGRKVPGGRRPVLRGRGGYSEDREDRHHDEDV